MLNKATSKVFALLLADNKPNSLLSGAVIDIGKALALINRLEYHHIFPKAYLKTEGYTKDEYDIHLNICMLNLTNNREISDKKPSEYFPEIKRRLGDNLESVLLSNYLDMECFEHALVNDFEAFAYHRAELLSNKIEALIS